MTDGHVPDHGDDEQLSAHLDGEDAPGVAAHLAECATCRARAAELSAVSRAVAGPPPLPDAAVEGAVQAALATWEEEAAERAPTQPAPADVVPLAAPRGRRRPPTVALSVAAAVLAVLVAVPLLLAGGDGPGGREEVTGRAAEPPTEAGEAGESPLAMGPDLGDQSDPAVLRQVVGDALRARTGTGDERAGAPRREAADTATAAAPSTAAEAGPAGESSGDGGDAGVISACARSLRASSGARLGPLVYGATLRWQGRPAVVLAYRVPGGENGPMAHQVFVMAREDCRVLVFQGL